MTHLDYPTQVKIADAVAVATFGKPMNRCTPVELRHLADQTRRDLADLADLGAAITELEQAGIAITGPKPVTRPTEGTPE